MTSRFFLLLVSITLCQSAIASPEPADKESSSLRADELGVASPSMVLRKESKAPPVAPAAVPKALGLTVPTKTAAPAPAVIQFAPAEADDPLPSPYTDNPNFRNNALNPNGSTPAANSVVAPHLMPVPAPSMFAPSANTNSFLPGSYAPTEPAEPGSVPPPSLPPRPPIPTPPAVTLLPPRTQSQRVPLAWRARAYELVSSAHGGKYSGVRLTHDFASSANDTFAALAQACDQLSMRVESVSVPAHQIALRNPGQDKVIIVIAADQTSDSGTTLIGGLFPDSKAFGTSIINDIFEKTESILNNKGML